MATLSRLSLMLGLALLMSCGDPLVDGDFRGTPLATFEGEARGEHPEVELGSKLVRLGLFWSTKGTGATSFNDMREQRKNSIAIEIPRSWTLNVFDPPPDEVLTSLSQGRSRFAVGRLLTYVDANANGSHDSGETVVGADLGRTIIYAPRAIAAADSPTGLDLPAGYHLATGRLPCRLQTRPPAPAGNGACNVPIGNPCDKDDECGVGICLRGEFILPWIGGACVVPNPPPNNCKPEGGVLVRGPQNGQQSESAYWIRACEVTSDCERPRIYACDQTLKACMPSGYIRMEIGPGQTLPQTCQ